MLCQQEREHSQRRDEGRGEIRENENNDEVYSE